MSQYVDSWGSTPEFVDRLAAQVGEVGEDVAGAGAQLDLPLHAAGHGPIMRERPRGGRGRQGWARRWSSMAKSRSATLAGVTR